MDTRPFSPDVILTSIPALLPYLEVTLMVGLISVVTGSAFGLLLAWARLSGNRILSSLAEGYTYIIRCTPSIVLLFIVFYGLPVFARDALGIDLDNLSRAIFVIITFTLLFGGFVSEVFRSAYLAVPKGQYEAAVTIGLSPWKAFLTVVMPQAAVIALPNFGNSVINLLKESALGRMNLIISQNYGAYGIELYAACMLIYWMVNILLERTFLFAEKRLSHRE